MKNIIQIEEQEEVKTLLFIMHYCLLGEDRMGGMLYELCVDFELHSSKELQNHIDSLKESNPIKKIVRLYDKLQKFNTNAANHWIFFFYSEFWDKVEKGIRGKIDKK